MNVGEIKNAVMFQTNNDVDDIMDYVPYMLDYINEGYDKLVYAYAGMHLGEAYPQLAGDSDTPKLPDWTHRALVDYATWLVYRNGNAQKQQRGYAFRTAFEEVLNKVLSSGGPSGKVRNFINIPQ